MADDTNKKIQEMQILEQNLQNLLLQKQAFHMELSEITTALKEIDSSKGDVFKIIGQLMLKTDRSNMKSELESKKRFLELRLNSIEKQETSFTTQLESLRDEIIKKSKKN